MVINCWEAKKCGRQPGGEKVTELGVCPAAVEEKVHGLNRGINGGRTCWAIKQTLCGDKKQGCFSEKFATCLKCEFYTTVREEEAGNFVISKEILAKLN